MRGDGSAFCAGPGVQRMIAAQAPDGTGDMGDTCGPDGLPSGFSAARAGPIPAAPPGASPPPR